jgi:hypothetical protein
VTRLVPRLALAAALAVPAVATFAQEAADADRTRSVERPVEAEVKPTEPSGPNTGKVSVSGGIDFTTAYFFRGYNQEDQGLIAEPYANLYFKLYDTDAFKTTFYVGTWNSLHSEDTLAQTGGGPDAWYESDFLTGVDFAFGHATIGLIYTAYTYPNGAFETVQELGAKLSYDDTDFMKNHGIGFGFKPYVAAYAETNDGNGSEDWYGEVGIAPGVYTFNKDGRYPVAITIPITVGLSLKDYYFDDSGDEEFFGYAAAGVTASIPLPFIPSDYGTWSLTGSFQYMYLNAEGLQTLNHGDDHELIGKIGIAFAY